MQQYCREAALGQSRGGAACNVFRKRALSTHVRATSKPQLADPPTSRLEPTASAIEPEGSQRKRATLKASALGRQAIAEKQKPLSAYMSLPASQYSVLDARRIERVDDSTFRCYVGELRFFSWAVEPVITVSVEVEQGLGCTIRLLGCKLEGSPFVQSINDKFSATMTNVVRYADVAPAAAAGAGGAVQQQQHDDDEEEESPANKQITSTTSIQVVLEVPAWSGFLPVASIESVGSGVMQGVLNAMVPRFLAQLRRDYELWAAGDDSRKPVGNL